MVSLTQWPRVRREFFQRWDEPREHEPAHAYLSRLAGLNLQTSARVFAEEMGLDGRQLPPDACLEAVRHLPIAGLDRLIAATPVVTKRRAQFLGHSVRRKHWSGDEPRWCPGCIAESPHYRVYHGLLSFTICPFHAVPIEIGTGGDDSLSWRHPNLAFTPNGRRVGRKMPRHEEPIPSFERWVLGQLGVIEPWSIPILDGVPLDQAIDTVDLLGRAAVRGWSRQAPRIRTGGLTRRDVVARGFEVLLGGPAAIEVLFERIAAEAGDRPGPKDRVWGLNQSYGWLFNAVLYGQRAGHHLPAVKTAVGNVAMRRGAFARQTTSLVKAEAGAAYLHREEVARVLDIQPRLVDRIAQRLNIRAEVHGRRFVMYARADVEHLQRELADALLRNDAAQALGLSVADFAALEAAGLTRPFCRLGGGTRKHDRFRRFELYGLLAAATLKASEAQSEEGVAFATFTKKTGLKPGQVATLIGAGRLTPIRRDPSLSGFQGLYLRSLDIDRFATTQIRILHAGGRERLPARGEGLTHSDAQAELGVEAITLQALLAQGYLTVIERRHDGARERIDPESIEAFSAIYAPAADYADALGCSRRSAIHRLRALGIRVHVRPVNEVSSVLAFVVRSEVKRALGFDKDPLGAGTRGWRHFWEGFRRYLADRKSVFRLVRAENRAEARLLSGDRRTSCTIGVTDDAVEQQAGRSAYEQAVPVIHAWSEIYRRLENLAYDQRSVDPRRSHDNYYADGRALKLKIISSTHRRQRIGLQYDMNQDYIS